MLGIAYQAELALDLLERLLMVETAIRGVGMELEGTQQIDYLWHCVLWERRETSATARMVFVFKPGDRPEAKSEVDCALATVPIVRAHRSFPEKDSHVMYEVDLDLSDLPAVAKWITSRSPSDMCPVCGRQD